MPSHKRTTAVVAFTAVLAGTVALNAILGLTGRSIRVDCTQERLYTLSPGVKELARSLDEPIKLDLYWSASVGNDVPMLRTYAQRVGEFLDELVRASDGMLQLRRVDPEPSSEAEDEARAAGIAALSVDGVGRTLSLGLVIRGATDQREVLPYLDPGQEPFLEYEVARRILALRGGRKPVVAVMSSLPLEGSFDPRNPQRPAPPPMVIQQLRQLFDLRSVDAAAPVIPSEAETLVVIQPSDFSDDALKAIDGWVVAGKPTLLFLDPWCETDPKAQAGMMQGAPAGTTFDLGPLLARWGIEIPRDSVVGDRGNATRIRARTQAGRTMELDYVPWLSLTKGAFASGDPVVGSLSALNVLSAGSIRPLEGGTTTIEPVLTSSPDAQMIETMRLGFFGQPDQLLKDFVPLNSPQTLAARVTGPIVSAYPPAKEDGSLGEAATGNANLMVIADADLLSDQTWVSEERFAGQLLGYRTIADNGSLVLNAVEALGGGQVLASLRGRGEFRRPFDRVETLRRDAEGKYLAEEQALQTSIQESQARISQLQREKGAGQNSLILSPEQEAELAKLNATVADARKKLREVQYRLRRDIDGLGNAVMLVNVVLWPIVVAGLASMWTARRMVGQRRGGGGR